MPERKTIEERLRRQLSSFVVKAGLPGIEIRSTTNLINDAGLTSLQGLEFVLDLCDEFDYEFPKDFNPFVNDEHHQGQTFNGLVKAIELHLASKGASDGKKR